jgi:cytochrome c5
LAFFLEEILNMRKLLLPATLAFMLAACGHKEEAAAPAPAPEAAPPQAEAPAMPAPAPVTSAPEAATSAAPAAGAASSATADTGEHVFNTVCTACHGMGIAGAPKVGDKTAWDPRIAQGDDVLYKHAIAGFTGKSGTMPAKGGRSDLSDADVKAAVDYMVSKAKG